MESHEKQLMHLLSSNVDAFEQYFENNADAPVVSKRIGSQGASLGKAKGNPAFSAQFDLQLIVNYYTLTSGSYTQIAASSLSPTLKTPLPAFLFGWNDWQSGYPKLRQAFPVNVWTYGRPGIFGKNNWPEYSFDATVNASLQLGDMVLPFSSTLPGTGTTTLALVIIRSPQVAYGTLMESMVSDKFVMNMIRYQVPDQTAQSIAQFSNNIYLFTQSLFGATKTDFVSPNSFKDPKNQQINLIDIALKRGIDKEKSMAMYINFDVPANGIVWSTFVWSVHKL